MPATRSRAAKEPHVQKLEEKVKHIEKDLEKLREGLDRALKQISEDFKELGESHDDLWDWHQRHCDAHKADVIKEPSFLRTFYCIFVEVFACGAACGVGASLCAVLFMAAAYLFDFVLKRLL